MLSGERQDTISEAKRLSMNDDIRPSVLREAGQIQTPEADMFEPLFEQELRKYEIYTRRLEESVSKQNALLTETTVSSEIKVGTPQLIS